jgi:predicted Zn-dependent protease
MAGSMTASREETANEALERAVRLLDAEPEAALTLADAVLKNAPGLPPAEMIACQALRRLGNAGAALPRLAALARRHPGAPPVLWEWAQAASEAGDVRQAIAALESLTRQQPGVASGWFLLAGNCARTAATKTAGAPTFPASTPLRAIPNWSRRRWR